MYAINKRFSAAIILLISAFIFRGFFLEYADLIDPTEARYANVAQEMYLSGKWVTPQIHMPEGVVPYLGKPPLHFWLTGIFYKVFGMEEWTARLASYFAAALILFYLFQFSKNVFSKEVAIISCLICFSSGMFFFLSGASVTDVTLTALIFCSIYYLYKYTVDDCTSASSLAVSSLFAALAFLTKGPVAIVLIIFPFMLWSALLKDFSWLTKLNWVLAGSIFFLVASPWFILSELENPGFLKYFIWNENIARYLFKDYGDKYGSGHVYFRGSSWWMLLAAFFPWTLILLYKLHKIGWKKSVLEFAAGKEKLFILCWALSTPIFFTFVRQLHAMYLLPAIPPLAILTALAIEKEPWVWSKNGFKKYAISSIVFFILAVIVCSILFDFSNKLLWFFAAFYLVGMSIIWRQNLPILNIQAVSSFFVFFVTFYFVAIVCYTPYMDNRRSAENILLEFSESYEGKGYIPKIGVISHSIFSHYWTANAWETELKSKISVRYIDPLKLKDSDIDYVLFKDKLSMLPSEVSDEFVLTIDKGTWKMFKRKPRT